MSLKEILWLIIKLIPVIIFLIICIGVAFIVYCILCTIMLVIYAITFKDRLKDEW